MKSGWLLKEKEISGIFILGREGEGRDGLEPPQQSLCHINKNNILYQFFFYLFITFFFIYKTFFFLLLLSSLERLM